MAESDIELADRELEMLQSFAMARGIVNGVAVKIKPPLP